MDGRNADVVRRLQAEPDRRSIWMTPRRLAARNHPLSGDVIQNIPFGFAAGMFGAYQLAALAGVPTTCKTSQCSIAFPSVSIL